MNALRYNKGKRQYSLIDYELLAPMVEALEYGKHKYSIFKDADGNEIEGAEISVEESKLLTLVSSGKDNWKIGFPIDVLKDSLYRHVHAYNSGEKFDKESGCHHLGHALCNIKFILNQEKLDNERDSNKSDNSK